MSGPAKILVVDDTPQNVKLLADLLTVKGYDVATAASGAEALGKIETERPDLVLLDVVMPGMSGYEVCREIRENPATGILPVVLVTALDPAQERIRGLEAGADDFLTREYHAEMGKLILAHEGTLERFTGDGMMIFFNDPVPVLNPAERAIRMALVMRDRVGELLVKWRKRGYELDFGVGIAQGYATIGAIGFEGRWDYGAIGTVTNLAARLCGEAKPGQILISQRLLAALEELVETEPVGELALKGFHRSITAHNVLRLRR